MEMEKSFYLVSFKPAYAELLREMGTRSAVLVEEDDEAVKQRTVVALTQGGFGQDVVDDERQVKERFLEYLFVSGDVDLPRSADVFDEYFNLEPVGEFIDLDEQ
jgi:hypothetical protein